MASQLIFDFRNQDNKNFTKEDFIISPENEVAVKFLQKFFSPENLDTTPIYSTILKGETCSGKTHLLHSFSPQNTIFLPKNNLAQINFSAYFSANNFYILEDFEEILDEELLLHLINSASEAKAFLILSCQEIKNYKLQDLDSRIKNIFVVELKAPESELIRTLLYQGFSKIQLKINDEIINFLANNLKRNYKAIFSAIKMIENYCHENKRNINLSEARKIVLSLCD